jgi:hypothetical protein
MRYNRFSIAMKKATLVLSMLALLLTNSYAQKPASEEQLIKDANQLFASGQFLKAFPLYSQLVSLYPQHPDYNYRFGACAIYSDQDKNKAIKYLTIATNKGVSDPMAWYYLGKAHHLNYEFKPAIKAYEEFIAKADPKVVEKVNPRRDIETCVYGSGLLSNIKDVVVINKTESDKENFFRYFNLEDIGGRILTVPAELKTKMDEKSSDPGVMHYPGNSTTIYFSSYGKDGSTGKDIYKANILPDGKFSTPEKLGGGVNTKYDEDFCFMHSDGKTLYFSSKGHNSMGGYDIFKCEYNAATNSFGQAINLDFAINTPDDDIFYCVDSKNEKAYFASARSSDQGHINVYNVMVQGIPLNVVYIKGEFVNDISPDEKTAGLRIKSIMSGGVVSDGTSDAYTGKYVVYAPKGGQYKMEVQTTNSPIVHQTLMDIPSFDHPVAVRQELRLIKENGVEKLIVNNYFEEIPNEDLAALAADMLRKKARLDVNADDVAMELVSTSAEPTVTMEKTMETAPLAAGFPEGTTLPQVLSMMEADVAELDEFVKSADQKSDAAYAYALSKQTEAEATLRQAENIRQTAGTPASPNYVADIRESHRLSLEAEKLRNEASNSMAAAEALKMYRSSENQRKEDLKQRMTAMSQANKSNDVNGAFAELKTEKDRQTALRGGQTNPPMEEMKSKAKAKDSEEKASLEKLDRLRNDEKQFITDMKIAEDKMSSSKKKADKEAAELEYATLKGKLDNKRREILNETIRAEKLGKESADLKGQVEFYASLINDNTNLGLNSKEQVVLSEPERNTLRAKLKEMDGRLNALEITDPQMLALVGDMQAAPELTASNKAAAAPGVEKTTSPTSNIRAEKQAKLERYSGESNIMIAGRRMVLAQEVNQTNNEVAALESKPASSLTESEANRLGELIKYRTELKAELAGQVLPSPAVSGFNADATCALVDPSYTTKKQAIQSGSANDLDREMKELQLKEATIAALKNERISNSEKAASEKDIDKATQLASKDMQLEAAIIELEKDVNNINSVKAAYETENKDIIENNALIQDKLKTQVDLTENYVEGLKQMETAKRSALSSTTDPDEAKLLEKSIADITAEKALAESRLSSYQNDLDLTMAASDPIPGNNANRTEEPQAKNLEDVVRQEDARFNFDTPTIKGDDEEAQSKVEKDSETVQQVFKPVKEEESIYAYESGALDELSYKYTADSVQLRNRDKIVELQDNIFLIEAEIENEKNLMKQKKLDKDAEKLYLKKALLEIGNAENVGKMTRNEYDELLAEVQKLNIENKAKIDSRVMLKDEVKSLYNKAKDEMEDAAVLRKRAYPVVDDIEKNDFFRRAFAKEMYAISLLKQVEGIHENLDLMLQYDDQQLTALRYGKLEVFDEPELAEVSSANSSTPTESGATKVDSKSVSSNTTNSAGVASNTVTSKSTNATPTAGTKTTANTATNSNTAANTTNTVASPNSAANNLTSATNNVPVTKAPQAEIMESTTLSVASRSAEDVAVTVMSNPSSGIDNKDVLMNSSEFKSYVSTLDEASTLDKQRMDMIRDRNALAGENNTIADQIAALEVAKANASTPEEKAALQKQIDKLAVEHETNLNLIRTKDLEIAALADKIKGLNGKANDIYSKMSSGEMSSTLVSSTSTTTRSASSGESVTTGSSGNTGRSSAPSESVSLSNAKASAGSYSTSEASSMLFDFPEVLEKDLFFMTNNSVYSAGTPIPVNAEMPKGIYYKVQVGAFRNSIPQNLYDEFAPVSGETLSNGITRYTAGFFLAYENADRTKKDIRSIGYSDAFVVAFRDGKRIPLYEAMGMTESDFQASVEKEYVHGDGGKRPESPVATSGGTSAKSGEYYKKYPNAAKANQVEEMTGLFFTVQVGVYTKPVPASSLYNMSPLNSELTTTKKIRYSSGVFTSMQDAVNKRAEARSAGISDAFITAYHNGNRITLSEADKLIKEYGPSIFLTK